MPKKKKRFVKRNSKLNKELLLNVDESSKERERSTQKGIKRTQLRGKISYQFPLFRKIIKSKILVTSFILGVLSLLIYILDISNAKEFVISISDFNSVALKEIYRADKPTSPLCGCLNDSVAHDGIMIPAQYCKISKKKNLFPFANFLITCPDEGVLGPGACYSYDTKIYRLNSNKYHEMSMADISSLIESDTINFKPWLTRNNKPFLSIITSKDIEVYSKNEESVLAFIGSVKGSTIATKMVDKYEGEVNKINITNSCDLGKEVALNKVPALDFHSSKIYIKWIDSFEILSPDGSSKAIDELVESYRKDQKEKDIQSYKDVEINVAVVTPKNSIRVSILPWNRQIQDEWEDEYFSQFPDSENDLFILNVPIWNKKSNTPILINTLSIKPFRIPNYLEHISDVSILVEKLMKDSVYQNIFRNYTKEGGYYYLYDNDDYELITTVDVTNAVIDSTAIKNRIYSMSHPTKAHELLKIQKDFINAFDFSKGVKKRDDTIWLKGREEYFRYPPLHKEEGISFYTKFKYAKFIGCDASIHFGSTSINITNQVLEIDDIKDGEYDYPSLFTSINGQTEKTTLKFIGKISIDGNVINENLLENSYVLMFCTLATLVSFVVGLLKYKRKS